MAPGQWPWALGEGPARLPSLSWALQTGQTDSPFPSGAAFVQSPSQVALPLPGDPGPFRPLNQLWGCGLSEPVYSSVRWKSSIQPLFRNTGAGKQPGWLGCCRWLWGLSVGVWSVGPRRPPASSASGHVGQAQ